MRNRRYASGVLAAAVMFLGGTVFATLPAQARTNHALLVAVTKYPNVKGADLVGPNNDAQLVRDFLLTSAPVPFAPENVTLLADGVDGARGSPTHKAIEAALAEVAAKAERGDFVYLHLSGHGMQQPAADVVSEPDGMDEVFLPADITDWVDRTAGVPNAFADDEIGSALDAIRAKGAFVWIVIDACHSGTATRGAPVGVDDVTERKLDPKLLGIPDSAFAEAIAEAGAATRSAGPAEASRALSLYANDPTAGAGHSRPTGADAVVPGGMVAFFAAQTVETTPEMLLPRGADDARKLGLFTYTLFSRVAENPNVSYRQLGQSIMQAYSAENRSRPTPLFEGNLDAPVFGMDEADFVQQWKIAVAQAGVTVPAGRMHRLSPGAKLAILPSPAASDEEAIGYLEVRSSENLTSGLSPVEYAGKPAISPAEIPANAYARLAELSFDTELVVSLPPESADFPEQVAEVKKLLDAIVASEETPVKLKLVPAGESADLKLAVLSEAEVAILVADAGAGATSAKLQKVATRGAMISEAPRLWLLPPTAEISLETGRRPPSIGFEGSTPDGLKSEIADSLVRVFRATNLARLASNSTFRPEEFEVGFKIRRSDMDEVEPLEAGTLPKVHPLDQVHLEARNDSSKAVDLNVLYIGSDYSISHMYAQRLHGGSAVDLPLLEFNDESYGIERMVVVLTEGSAISTVEDLSFLEQEGVRVMTRSASYPDGFSGLLRDIGSAPATRGAARIGAGGGAKGAVMIFPLENMPRD